MWNSPLTIVKVKGTYCLPSEVFDKKMASRFVVQTTAKRQFAAQAAVARTEHVVPKAEPLKVSTLKNGLTVASVGNWQIKFTNTVMSVETRSLQQGDEEVRLRWGVHCSVNRSEK